MTTRQKYGWSLIGAFGLFALMIMYAWAEISPIERIIRVPNHLVNIAIDRREFLVRMLPHNDRVAAQQATAVALVAAMRNSDLQWTTSAYAVANGPNGMSISVTATPRPGTPTAQLSAITSRSAVAAACMPALDDPDRFQAAQILLTGNYAGWGVATWNVASLDEMKVSLPTQPQVPHDPVPFTPIIDSEQRHRLELLWHHRKDDLMAAIPLWPLLLIPIGIVLRSVYSNRSYFRRRRPANGCIGCGYNLTGNTSGICPECGTKMVVTSTPVG